MQYLLPSCSRGPGTKNESLSSREPAGSPGFEGSLKGALEGAADMTSNVFVFGELVARAHSSRRMVQAHSADEHAHCRRRCYCGAGDREDKGQSDWTGAGVGTISPNEEVVSNRVPTLAWATSCPRSSAMTTMLLHFHSRRGQRRYCSRGNSSCGIKQCRWRPQAVEGRSMMRGAYAASRAWSSDVGLALQGSLPSHYSASNARLQVQFREEYSLCTVVCR